ncbi:hypothetical protein [Paenibacillus sp. GbtcB18]|uniref:hypothetical protein n=1 Tax=Paenibacillus sp. GbtcB18 TaxID=2824763 RepID=UPI001C2F2A83|nr:hypothetical protein [Paenibacillus sp. GbtcB18]
MKNVNQWHIYSWMKTSWMTTGAVPSNKQVIKRFSGVDTETLIEGIVEFRLAYDRDLKHIKNSQADEKPGEIS